MAAQPQTLTTLERAVLLKLTETTQRMDALSEVVGKDLTIIDGLLDKGLIRRTLDGVYLITTSGHEALRRWKVEDQKPQPAPAPTPTAPKRGRGERHPAPLATIDDELPSNGAGGSEADTSLIDFDTPQADEEAASVAALVARVDDGLTPEDHAELDLYQRYRQARAAAHKAGHAFVSYETWAHDEAVNGCGDCFDCLDRRVLHLLMQQSPTIRELYETEAARESAERARDALLKQIAGAVGSAAQ